jgi:hypothetical protein
LLKHVEARSDHYLSCIYAVIREWCASGKRRTKEHRHDFREWSQTLDWIVREIFMLPPLLEGHRSEQLRISSAGLSFLRDIALLVQRADMFSEELGAAGLASLREISGIDVPGCPAGADPGAMARRIGSLIAPLFREAESVEVEGFTVKRIVTKVYDEERKENREMKCYVFEPRR